MSKPLLLGDEPELVDGFRSGLEEKIAAQLKAAGIEFDFEQSTVPYVVPSRKARYLPDFVIPKTGTIIEGKGRFTSHMTRCPRCKHCYPNGNGSEARQKMALVKAQNPELDIRFIFNRASTPIYPKSKTTYAKWCEDHGFKWADKGKLPADWIKELKG